MQGFSYIITRDYGFAPNPFGKYCTLATCKPRIRKAASVGDWIFALASATRRLNGPLVCMFQVAEKITFDDYWRDLRFQYKKPNMNGSLVQAWGDNIYHKEDGRWVQDDSHHSNPDGSINPHNLRKDTGSTDFVLIAEKFYYWGKTPLELPPELFDKLTVQINHRNIPETDTLAVVEFVEGKEVLGLKSDPYQFETFEHYDGVS